MRVSPQQVTSTAQTCLSKLKSGEYILHTFAAFITLSYTKLVQTSGYLIRENVIYNATGGFVRPNRIFFAGQFNINDKLYIYRYFMPACVVLVLTAIPPIFLLGYPVIWTEKLLMYFPRVWKFYPCGKVHILLDTFQGCYKDNRRFFAGLYFIFRYIITIVYISTDEWIVRYMVQQIVCIVMVLVIAVCWPYAEKKSYLNYVDLFLEILQ